MEWGAIILLAVIGWGIAIAAVVKLRATLRELSIIVGDGSAARRLSSSGLLHKASLLAAKSYEGESVNNLLRVCHSDLGASAVELTTNAQDLTEHASAAAIRLTSGRPVSINATAHPLKLGGLTIGHLRFDAPPLSALQVRLLKRIAQALTLQIIADRTGRELRQLAGAQSGDERARMGFVATLSHELRGPLGMVLNAVELVRDELCGPVTSDQRETLGLVHGNVRHLLSLVNDVLDFAKTESGTVAPKRESIPFKPLLEELVGSARGQADAKSQRLSLVVADDVSVLFDERNLRQVVLNLLTNAIKYTPQNGEVTVEARAEARSVVLSVHDTGVGIPDSERHKVFKPFERVSTGMGEQGTGLGMPLSKVLTEANGGVLDFTSQPNAGTTFRLTMESGARVPASNAQLRNGQDIKVSLRGQSLLLASRDQDQIAILSRALSALDAEVSSITAAELQHLLDGSAQQVNDVTAIILDSTMIGPSSTEPGGVIGKWVNLAGKQRVPLVMLTPRAFEFDTAEYLRSGVDVCVAKPFQTNELALTLQRLSAIPMQRQPD